MPAAGDAHYRLVARAILDGRVVPFLGAGVNLCDRAPHTAWQRGHLLPSGSELAGYLANVGEYPPGEPLELVRVSQYIAVTAGPGPLYEELHELFDAEYAPTRLHRFLASMPGLMRAHGTGRYPLIVTTNYDDALERSFRDAGEPFDLVSYIADGEHRGKFMHVAPDGAMQLIEKPNEYTAVAPEERAAILKIHGAVDRSDPENDSYVITEDHYIDYLTHTNIANLIPVTLAAVLRKSHLLFLGYSMRDWNLRVILHRIWGAQKLSYKSWSVQLAPDVVEEESWDQRGVDILDVSLADYIAALEGALQSLRDEASARA
jgi:SIR2-like domain